MAYNKIFADLPTDLHTIICKYNRNAIYALSKERLLKYNWKYLIKAVYGVSYNLPINEMMSMYDSLSKSKNIYCGLLHTIIRLNDGTLMACGDNGNGQLGFGDKKNRLVFEEIKGIPKNVVDVVCGNCHTIIRLSDRTIMACGDNYYGQLGLGDTKNRLIFEEIKGIPKNIVSIARGGYHTILRLSDGTLMACGSNYYGQLGLGDTENRLIFEEIKGIPKNVVEVTCGEFYTIIKLSDGTLMACGYNNYGQLGFGDTKDRLIFEEIKGIPKNVVDVSCGYCHTIIRLSDGTLMACGSNYYGQSGLGDTKDRLIFEVIKDIPKNVVDISCGEYHTIIRLNDGTLMACGDNDSDQLGFSNNDSDQLGFGDTKKRLIFEEIKGIPKNIVGIVSGGYHTIIRLSDGCSNYKSEQSINGERCSSFIGTSMACGNNTHGQLGLGDTNNRPTFKVIKNIPKN